MAKRRSRGEGTIYQRPDGLWSAQISLPNGKRKTKYGKSQKAVREWLQEQQNGLRHGLWTETEALTVSAFLERYMADVMAHTLRPKTQETYTVMIRKHLMPEIGSLRLTRLRPDHLQRLYSDRLSAGKSRRTVQHIHAVIHKALTHAVKWGLVVRNVADSVDVPRPNYKAPEILTQDHLRTFLDSVREDRLFALYVTAITTGMRKAELLGLRWSDVDLEAGIIAVNQVAQTVHKRGIVLSEPKTEQSRRSIDLPDVTVQALKAHRENQKRYHTLGGFSDQDLVFSTKRGTPIGSRNLLKYFHGALEKAGLPKVRFHSLRHLHATLLLVSGIHPKVVQERLGHSRIDITMDTYSHVLPGMQKPAAATMDKLLGTVTTA